MSAVAYWDSSAIIAALHENVIKERLEVEGGVTRTHALSEVFSTLTGGRLGFRIDADDVAKMIRYVASRLNVVELGVDDCLEHIDNAKMRGVRGGAIYDYLHAAAAMNYGCRVVYTLNRTDFEGLFEELKIKVP